MNITANSETANTHKMWAALMSVVAAVGLTSFKLVVGLATGSLGILAEAAHSALDLVAALVTFFAVRISGKAPDREHQYGHGKVENLSALFETLLLLATCVWIIYEAIQRLFFKSVQVEISIWAFVVMATSIVIDINRSRMLYKAARTYNSQALEADALHFSTDVWSSSVVILGLALALTGQLLGERYPILRNLDKADSVAALGVAMIVIYVSIELGMRTIHGLLDAAPKGMNDTVTELIRTIPGIQNVHSLRIRHSGPYVFIDVHVLVDGKMPLLEAHALTEQIEQKVNLKIPDSDITVHVEPATIPEESAPKEIDAPSIIP
jgi:cation diffusion facilitator family transporter